MNKRDLGEEIRNIVQDAFNNGDFKRLNRDIEGVVKGALSEVRKSVDWIQKSSQVQQEKAKEIRIDSRIKEKTSASIKKGRYAVPVGQVSGVLLTVFGAIGSFSFGVAILVLTILANTIGGKAVFNSVSLGLLPLFIMSIIASINGSKIRKRLRRFQRYISKMGNRDYSSIKELSYASGLNPKATVVDLKKMIGIGMFPEAHIDDKNTYFMINNQAYEEYVKLQESIRVNEINKKEEPKLDSEEKRIIDEGRQFVLDIRRANDDIPGEEISLKLDKLEDTTGRIFDYVEAHPEKLPEIRKFTEYFLPTTLKLLDGYKKLDHQIIEGQNISSAKREIEETLDTINLAFENLLDDLFVDIAMDISTDISVLETILAQEGLTEDSLRQRK